ncbi:MAG: hypothetical protein A2583_13660 [Bdellovibrionales bacterium RIFOXYD1_FULL_53_11]|nr:MAG: hypothetical protein A2583_13660 [Bdellovibrionales bacterium RIFOXYD1_FULL_53_11]
MKKNEIPLLYGSCDETAVFSAREYVEYQQKRCKKTPSVPKSVVLAFTPCTMQMARRICPDNVFQSGIGAPMAAITAEQLAARGVENIVAVGSAGSIHDNVNLGDIIVADRAVRDEGTSFHYLKPSWFVDADREWTDRIETAVRRGAGTKATVHRGTTWTTDAVYRETLSKYDRCRQDGVLCVEMEAAALFALASARKIRITTVHVVSDLIRSGRWNPQFHSPLYKRSLEIVLKSVSGIL